MTEAYIYDAIRTPRGRGKEVGALHQISPVGLASQTLKALEKRKISGKNHMYILRV